MEHTLFIDLTAIVCVVSAVSVLMKILNQPAIIGYILAGILVSPYGFNIAQSHAELAIFSQMGISFLLFMVGLNLNPRIVKETGRAAVIAGLGQVAITTLCGFFLSRTLGFPVITSLYLAAALTFSSTIIVMKVLSDKNELESLHGRLSTGILIVQDLVAMGILLVVSSVSSGEFSTAMVLLRLAERLIVLGAALGLVGVVILPRILKIVASSQELLLLFSIGWCFAVAALCGAVGLSMEIGALGAGVVLSLSPYRFEIAAKLKPMRDFFVVIFFVLVGAQMGFGDVRALTLPVVLLSLFVLIGNPLIMLAILGALRYTKRTSFRVSLTVAQVSEFSFVLAALGVRLGHIPSSILSLVTCIGLLTIAGSTYAMVHAASLFRVLKAPLSIFERAGHKVDEHAKPSADRHDILLLGYERVGLNVLEALKRTGKSFMVVDYNPSVIGTLAQAGIDCRYGDLGDGDFLQEMNFTDAKMVVSTIHGFETSVLIVRAVRAVNPHAIVIALSQKVDEALYLYELGASYVLTPQLLSGYHASMMIEEYGMDLQKFLTEKARHLKHLEAHRRRAQA